METVELLKKVTKNLKEAYEVSARLSRGSNADPRRVDAETSKIIKRERLCVDSEEKTILIVNNIRF